MKRQLEIDILTIFPEVVRGPLSESIIGRAVSGGIIELKVHDLRKWSLDRHHKVDDEPYGGGPGMVMKPEPFFSAVRELRRKETRVVLMTPQGRRLQQSMARDYAGNCSHLVILCGHYEGIDHRVVEALVDDEISIGDYVLTNGAVAAAVFVDSVTRLIPGVLGDERSSQEESFAHDEGILEAPCYTRPVEFEGMEVPEILLSGHHEKIAEWKRNRALERTAENRPDLLADDEGGSDSDN
ncbi:MAG: tRNA (guanosine(37)-N1)-methyltransferase TrmD [Verrucomicrobiaceae bacterium]|nr:tRNA (guanosine(37)-N1)-methyltransferase TrmD [Verrucomicrobiaceae bacterium]